mgnify:CR=1 FL=1
MSKVTWCSGMSLRTLEKKVILKCLKFHEGNKTKVAAELGVSLRTIDNKLKLYEKQDNAE